MRRQGDLWMMQIRGGGKIFAVDHIQPCMGDSAAFQGIQKGLVVDQPASGRVDDDHAVLCMGQHVSV